MIPTTVQQWLTQLPDADLLKLVVLAGAKEQHGEREAETHALGEQALLVMLARHPHGFSVGFDAED